MSRLAEKIREHNDLARRPIEIADWAEALGGDQVYVRELTAADQVALAALARKSGDTEDVEANFEAGLLVVVRSLVDEEGERVFEDEDLDWLRSKSARVITEIAGAALDLSGLDIEEAAGN